MHLSAKRRLTQSLNDKKPPEGGFFQCAELTAGDYTPKEEPQPQVVTAFGLSIKIGRAHV